MNFIQTTVPDSDRQHAIAAEADRWQNAKPPVEKDYITNVDVDDSRIYHTMILMGRDGEERLIDLLSSSDRFIDVIRIIRSHSRYNGWRIIESWEAKDEF